MIKGYKVKIHPNKEQQILMHKTFGCARFAYNWALAKQIENFENGEKFISEGDLRKQFTQFKKDMKANGEKWLYEISNNATKQAIKDCFKSYKNFFNKRAKSPKFKSKRKAKFSFYNDTYKIKIFEDKVQLEVIGTMNLAEKNRIPNGKIYNPRISFDGINYWLSVNIEVDENQVNENKTQPIGIDLGIKTLIICSNKMNFKRINTKKQVKKLKRLQRKASRHYTNMYNNKITEKSSNLLKLEKSILKQHHKISNIRLNNIHQATTKLVKLNPSHIVIEDLGVSNMMKNKHLSQKIADCSFYEIRRQLEYKCDWNKIKLVIADKWYPSSKTCSECGNKKSKLSLSERTYKCECCGFEIDRDLNASINLMNLAI